MAEEKKKITIGGGGPQAAWGAAAALAVMERMETSSASEIIQGRNDNETIVSNETMNTSYDRIPSIPLKQKVVFLGPVGNANGLVPDIQKGLDDILGPAVELIELVVEPSLQTPTIQLWHDEQQDIQWKPLNDSWGAKGADALWRNRPRVEDILQILDGMQQNSYSHVPEEGEMGNITPSTRSTCTDEDGMMDEEQMSD